MNALFELLERVRCEIVALENGAEHEVERFDLAHVRSCLESVVDDIKAIDEYRRDLGTDYRELWEQRKRELQQLREAKQSWLQTEIFKLLLRPS